MINQLPNSKLYYILSLVILFEMLIVTLTGLFFDIYDNNKPEIITQAKGQDMVTLFVVIPLLISSLVLSNRGNIKADICYLGVLIYVSYTYLSYAFIGEYNTLLLLYINMFSFSTILLLSICYQLDFNKKNCSIKPSMPYKATGLFLISISTLFLIVWLSEIISGILTNTIPEGVTQTNRNVIYVLDLGFLLPALLIFGYWMIQEKKIGVFISGALLIKIFTLGLALLSMNVLSALNNEEIELGKVILYFIITLLSFFFTIAVFLNLDGPIRDED